MYFKISGQFKKRQIWLLCDSFNKLQCLSQKRRNPVLVKEEAFWWKFWQQHKLDKTEQGHCKRTGSSVRVGVCVCVFSAVPVYALCLVVSSVLLIRVGCHLLHPQHGGFDAALQLIVCAAWDLCTCRNHLQHDKNQCNTSFRSPFHISGCLQWDFLIPHSIQFKTFFIWVVESQKTNLKSYSSCTCTMHWHLNHILFSIPQLYVAIIKTTIKTTTSID